MNYLLGRWGHYIALQHATTGYPTTNALLQALSGGRGRPGSRPLGKDLPSDVWRVEQAVNGLPGIYRNALLAFYALPPKEDGLIRTRVEIAALLGTTPGAFRKRVYRARQKLAIDLSQ